MTVILLPLLTKFLAMEDDIVGENRNTIPLQTMNKLFAPLPESDSGFPTCNKSLMIDDDLPTIQQLASQRLEDRSLQTSPIPQPQQITKPQDQQKSKKRRAKLNQSQKQGKSKRARLSKRKHNSNFEVSESESEDLPERFNVRVRQPQVNSGNDSPVDELSNSDSSDNCCDDESDSERMEQSIFL
jgi:hypothetical protein